MPQQSPCTTRKDPPDASKAPHAATKTRCSQTNEWLLTKRIVEYKHWVQETDIKLSDLILIKMKQKTKSGLSTPSDRWACSNSWDICIVKAKALGQVFPGSSVSKESACKAGSKPRIWSLGWEDALKKEMATHSVFLPGKSHGQRRLVGYSPWDRERLGQLDWACVCTHARTCTHTHTHTQTQYQARNLALMEVHSWGNKIKEKGVSTFPHTSEYHFLAEFSLLKLPSIIEGAEIITGKEPVLKSGVFSKLLHPFRISVCNY